LSAPSPIVYVESTTARATSSLAVLKSPQDVAAAEAGMSSAVAVDGLNNIIGTNGAAPEQPNERYKAISLQALDKVAEDHPQLKPHLYDVKLAGMVFPFKVCRPKAQAIRMA